MKSFILVKYGKIQIINETDQDSLDLSPNDKETMDELVVGESMNSCDQDMEIFSIVRLC